MARGWVSVRWLLAGILMLAGAIASFAASAPTAVGAVFLVLMVLCGVMALVVMLRVQADARDWARSVSQAQQPSPERPPQER
jgi:uncharacterized membrane-anchored protein